jgi:hypothetical protein
MKKEMMDEYDILDLKAESDDLSAPEQAKMKEISSKMQSG